MKANEPQYKDKKFKSKEAFEKWLKETAKYKITFEDDGQDFLVWFIDERGEVIHCTPFQASVWNGMMVCVDRIKIGQFLPLMEKDCIVHKVKSMETLR